MRAQAAFRIHLLVLALSLFLFGQVVLAIQSEVPGQAELVSRYFIPGYESVALRSHATGSIRAASSCSGAWIGPTFFMTAAHCGGMPASIEMRAYVSDWPDGSLNLSEFRSYTCDRQIVSAFWVSDADLAIFQCGSTEEVKPGDLFGWLNYDLLTYDNVGDPVYSVWFNPISDQKTWGPPWTKIYSAGIIASKTGTAWPAPSCAHGQNMYTVNATAYAAGGASGSPTLSAITHSIVVGPLSTAHSAGGPSRNASSMASILNVRDNPPGEIYLVEETFRGNAQPRPPGAIICEPPLWDVAETDANRNLVFDVQELFEDRIENREIYTLNFNSGWRRVLWELGDAFSGWVMSPLDRWERMAHLESAADHWVLALAHDKLSLAPDTEYHIRLELLPRTPVRLKVEVVHDQCPVSSVERGVQPNPHLTQALSPELHQWTTFALTTGPCEGYGLRIYVAPGSVDLPVDVLLQEVVIAEAGARWAFETWDQRESWTVNKTGHALILTNGDPATGLFGANVTGHHPQGSDDTLVNPSLPILADTRYRLTFSARRVDGPGAAYVRIESPEELAAGGQAILVAPIEAGQGWETFAYEFTTGTAHDYVAIFGHDGEGSVVIDDIVFEAVADM